MIDWNKPIETLGGNPAKVVSTDFRQACGAVFVAVQIEHNAFSFIGKYDQKGKPDFFSPSIRNVLVKREGWMAVYRDKIREGVRDSSPLYDTLEECMKLCGAKKVAAYAKVEWEEYP